MPDKTIAMADNQTKRMDAHEQNRLHLQVTSIETQKDEYQIDIDKRIGIGGESQVFLAKRLSDDKEVVVKIYDTYADLPQNRRDRKAILEFLRNNSEYKYTHIMPLWDDGKIEMYDPESDDYFDRPFDIIPYCPNGEIKSADYNMLKNKVIPEVLTALNLIHSNNLVHRDIKPSNIYMFEDMVLLADFGTTSQIVNKESHSKTQTRRGTSGYTAPEISDSYYVVASDYYSLGCSIATLYNGGKHIYQNLIDANDIESVNIAMRRSGLPLECPANESDLQLLVDSLIIKNEQQRAGFEAINLWLYNTNSFVHKWKGSETQEPTKATVSYKFEGVDYTKLTDLAVAIANNWEKGKQYLYRGIFKGFFNEKEPALYNILFDIMEDPETAKDQDLGLARFLHFLGTSEATTCPIYWCGKTYEKLSDLSLNLHLHGEGQGEGNSKLIISLLKSKFLSWKLTNTKPINQDILKTIGDIESVTLEYENLGYFYLIQTVAKDKPNTIPDDIFKELTQNENDHQAKMKNILTNDNTFAHLITQGYKKAVLELYKNKTGNFTSEDENSDLLLLYLFFEGICKNKELVKEYYLKFGPQARIYQKFKSEINITLSIIGLFDKLKKLKIYDDYQKKIEEEEKARRKQELERIKIKEAKKKLNEYLQVRNWVTEGLCGHCGGEFSGIFNKKCKKCGKDKSDNNLKKYFNIGDIGPAGGIIFYDKGSKSDDWRHLEAAPPNTEFKAEWGAYGKDVSGTETGIGYGKSNTQIIAKFLNNIGKKDKAAQRCLALNINGHNDWFLPSKDELNEMYKQRNIISGFNVDAEFDNASVYWSSSQGSGYYNYAWNQYFNNGNQNYTFKNSTGMVRAVRAF